MTLKELTQRVDRLEKQASQEVRDAEHLHGVEREIVKDVLEAIADRTAYPTREYAAQALRAMNVDFPRWMA